MTVQVDDALARRNARVFAAAQGVGGANPAIVVSLGGLVGTALAPSAAYATLPVTILHVGVMAGTLPVAALIGRFGRRPAYLGGALVGVGAGCLAAYAVAAGSFLLFCTATFAAGLYHAGVNSYRFAAADTASPAFRTRAISWVMLGGIGAAVIGPQTVIWTRDLVPGSAFAGGFLGQAGLALVSIAILAAVRPPPAGPAGASATAAGPGRPLSQILAQPRFVLAASAGIVSFGLMSLVMTAAPIAMVVECGLPIDAATLGIQWHILGMFVPSLVTGRLIERFGRETITLAGLGLIAVAALIGLSGREVGHFWAALVIVGIGWNFGFIGATALVADCCRPEERTRVQGANDFLIFGTVALTSLASGTLQNLAGWQAVNWLVLPIVTAALVALALSRTRWPIGER